MLDIIGDVHGCLEEFKGLLNKLGYSEDRDWCHEDARSILLLGDLTDRGPENIETILFIDTLLQKRIALWGALGNHDWRLYQYFIKGKTLDRYSRGMDKTVQEICKASSWKQKQVLRAIERWNQAPSFTQIDLNLFVTHAGLTYPVDQTLLQPDRQDPLSQLCLYGEKRFDDEGKKITTFDWMQGWKLPKQVVFGHNVCGLIPQVYQQGAIIALDTGCVFGQSLSAYRYPEKEFVSSPARKIWSYNRPVDSLRALSGIDA
jgi:hypothetical protein